MKRMLKVVICFFMITVLSAGLLAMPALGANSANSKVDLSKKVKEIYSNTVSAKNTSDAAVSNIDHYEFYETEPNNWIYEANVISNNYKGDLPYFIVGTITDYYFDIDYYRFTVNSRGKVELIGGWIGDFFGYGWEDDLLFGLMDSQGNIIAAAELVGDYPETLRYLSADISAGTYYIFVFQNSTYEYLYIDEPYGIILDFTPSINYVTVNFNSQGGTSVPSITVAQNSTITAPTAPTRPGYTFGGWYKEAACINPWNFRTDVVTGNMTLYAKWIPSINPNVKRIAGNNRYETAVKVSQTGWTTANTVILARGDDYADALAGVPLAHQLNAPILLTQTESIVPATIAEISRLKAQRVILLGGHGAISDNVMRELKSQGLNVERIQGRDRYETAAHIAEYMAREGAFDTAFVAVGTNFADALAASSYAAVREQPILLTATNSLPQATKNAIADLGIKNTVVCGGPAVVSNSVFSQLPYPKRIYGDNRYLTALELAKEFMPEGTKHVYVATGLNFPDAIAGGVLAANNDSGILLVQGNYTIPIPQVQNFYVTRGFTDATIFGGTAIVSSELEQWFKNPW